MEARALPWRAPPGAPRADPYRVWLSEIMLQQTTVAAVRPRFERFLARWPTVETLAEAEEADVLSEWAGLGYYARARSLVRAARQMAAAGFPGDAAGWRMLPGVGDYTAAAVAAIALGEAAVPVDANIARVGARLFAADLTRPVLAARLLALLPDGRAGDFAQALMDLGARICTPRAPRCGACPLAAGCAACAAGEPERWPARRARPIRPLRRGTAWWLECGGEVLLVRRPPRGLLGGMLALPSTPWSEAGGGAPPAAADWTLLAAPVEHVFTHFRLELAVAVARLGERPRLEGEWRPRGEVPDAGLPTLFLKAARMAAAA